MRNQVLFDFDGTITSRDTTIILIIELLKNRPFHLPGVMWFLLKMRLLRDVTNKQLNKNKAIGYLINGRTDAQLAPALNKFSKKVHAVCRLQILNKIEQAYTENNIILIVTASPGFAIKHCTRELPVTVLGTDFEKINDIYSGKLESNNCYGYEKVNRLKRWALTAKTELSVSSAWSDHFSDIHMLRLSEKRYWIGAEEFKEKIKESDPSGIFVYAK
jgi:phosphatidylglycerophosphatase C